MDINKYIQKINFLYANGEDPDKDPKYIDPLEMQKIKEALPVSPMVKKPKWKYESWADQQEEKPKKKIIKKTLIVEKPKPVKPLEWDWRLGDWRDLFDEDAPSPPPEDIEKVLNINKKKLQV